MLNLETNPELSNIPFKMGDIVSKNGYPDHISMVTNIIDQNTFEAITLSDDYAYGQYDVYITGKISKRASAFYTLFNGSITLSNQ